jgi:hypothetical protein
MNTDLNKYLMSQRDPNDIDTQDDRSFPLAKRITCKDGFSLSVQATHGSYCRPRTNIADWYMVEVGFPSAKPEFFADYAENHDKPTDTVYGYVPIELVEKCIDFHGGME